MKQLLIVLAALVVVGTVQAAEPLGVDFGMMMSKGAHPEFGYALYRSISVEAIGGALFKTVTFSGLYSDFAVQPSQEAYALRAFTGRRIGYKAVFAEYGVGAYTFVNSQGGDMACAAVQLGLGVTIGPAVLHFGGDVVSRDGNDIYYTFSGLSIKL